jgi:Wzt C-terminal domain
MGSSEQDSSERAAARQNGTRFISWELVDSLGNTSHTLTNSGGVTVRFILKVQTPIRHGHHGIALFNRDRQIVWGWAAEDLAFEPGQHELTYEFPYLPLCPGNYSWLLTLWSDGQNVDTWDAVPDLLIATENYQHRLDEWSGILNLPSRFSVRAERDKNV